MHFSRLTPLALLALAFAAQPATATTYTPGAALPDVAANNGDCSLRDAITASNTNAAKDTCPAGTVAQDEIVLGAGTYTLQQAGTMEPSNASGDLDVTGSNNLLIRGVSAASSKIDANNIDRVLDVTVNTASVTLRDLTVTRGRAPDPPFALLAEAGGAIRTLGTLTADRISVTGSRTGNGGGGLPGLGASGLPGGAGGGISNAGTLTLRSSTISGNATGAGGAGSNGISAFGAGQPGQNGGAGGPGGAGGGLFNSATLTLENVTIAANSTGNGGSGGAGGFGNAAIGGNGGSGGNGGAGAGLATTAAATLTGVSIAGNSPLGGGGGGGGPGIGAPSGTMGPGGSTGAGGGTSGGLGLVGSVVADNAGAQCAAAAADGGGNIASDASCGVTQGNPLLGALADNGGPTLTRLPGAGSPAIDSYATGCPATDQRGIARPQGANCDSGAVEQAGPAASSPGATPPSVGPSPPGALKLSLTLPRSLKSDKKGKIVFELNNVYAFALTGSAVLGSPAKSSAAFGRTSFKVAAKKKVTVTLKLSKSALKKLKKAKKLKATLTVSLKSSTGASGTVKRSLTVKRKK